MANAPPAYAGIGDITTVAKYLVLEEGDTRPAVSLEGGVGWPSGHASNLNPAVPGPGRHRHRVFQLHHRRQPVQMGKALPALQQYLAQQPG